MPGVLRINSKICFGSNRATFQISNEAGSVAVLVPADEHGDAPAHDVEPGLLLLGEVAVLAGQVRPARALGGRAPRERRAVVVTAAAAAVVVVVVGGGGGGGRGVLERVASRERGLGGGGDLLREASEETRLRS